MFRVCVYTHLVPVAMLLFALLLAMIGPLATLLLGLLFAVIGRRLVGR
jgi:hypothetical protein